MGEEKALLNRALEEYIRPATFPVAVKLAGPGEQPPDKVRQPVRELGHPVALCQGLAMARRYKWTMVFAKGDHGCPAGAVMLGHYKPDRLLEGMIAHPGYAATVAAGQAMEQANAYLPRGSAEAVWLAPLARAEFEPDVVVVYGNAAQVGRLIQAANYASGKGIESRSTGRMACSGYIARPVVTGECALIVPSGGERIFALAQDDELIFAIPRGRMREVAEGLAGTHAQGLARFPTPFAAITAQPNFPAKYREAFKAIMAEEE